MSAPRAPHPSMGGPEALRPSLGGPGAPHPTLQRGFAQPLLDRLCRAAVGGGRPVIALNGPVGAGKSSLGRWLQRQAARRGLHLGVASIDDAYLPWAQRRRAMAGNPFGVNRVPPGSHDTALLLERLADWRAGGELVLPRFDKRLRNGEGDRSGEERLMPDALLLEGWLLGCRSLGDGLAGRLVGWEGELAGAGPQPWRLSATERAWLPRWDRALAAYASLGDPACGVVQGLWVLSPVHWGLPRRWRLQAEARQRRLDGAALNPTAVVAIVRASLASLPPSLYQLPLIERAEGWALLDSRRRCVRSRTGESGQLSSSSPSLTG